MSLFLNVGDLVGLVVFAIAAIFLLAAHTHRAIRQAFCKHAGSIGETQACEAICHQCGKNLGFIGTWRKKARKEST